MEKLSQQMQERLEKWRKNVGAAPPVIKVNGYSVASVSRRSGKNDYGDAMSLEEWEDENKKSQRRK